MKPTLSEAMKARLADLCGDDRVKTALQVCVDEADRAMEEQIHISEIESPTFAEGVRGEEIARLLKEYGLTDVVIDPSGNVVGRRPGTGSGPVLAIAAHLDTVFPAGTNLKVRKEGHLYYGPGIGDNASGLRSMLQVLRALEKAGIETDGDILFVGTVGEEGNGDIRGSKHLFNGTNHIDGFLAVDNADMGRLLYAAIGSHRYRFTITGPGGHSWTNFSECPSAVHAMCLAGAKVAHVKVPEGPRTTFTIGTIKGGTSVNTIAASCQVDVDMRSLDDGNLAALEAMIFKCFEEGVAEENAIWGVTDPAKQVRLEVTMIGDRPGGQRPHDCPVLQTSRAAMDCLGLELKRYTCSSTDANKPVSLGIPATCLSGGGAMYRTHTVDEYYDAIHIEEGPKMVFLTACALAGAEGMKALLPKLPAA
mgnify:CR=1 FL=1